MFDITQRENLSGCSVKELIARLQRLQPNAIVCCCGADTMHLHVEQDGSAICLDVDDLEDYYPPVHQTEPAAERDKRRYSGLLFGKTRAWFAQLEREWKEYCADCCGKIARNWNKDHATHKEFVLAAQLRQAKEDAEYLRGELKRVRESDAAQQRKLQGLKEVFAATLSKPEDQLKSGVGFDVRKAEDGERWEVVTEYCCLGGCDMGVYPFANERDALIFAALLTVIDYKPDHNTACPTCYAEYMMECI